MSLITSTDISARLTADLYQKIFDKDRDGTADTSFLATCISTAESQAMMRCRAAFRGETFDQAGGTVDEAIKGILVDLAVWQAVKLSPLQNGEKTPFRQAYEDALKFLDQLARDDRNRTVTSSVGRPSPRAEVRNGTNESGETTSPFRDVADGKSGSVF